MGSENCLSTLLFVCVVNVTNMSDECKTNVFHEDVFGRAFVDRNESAGSDSDGISDSVVGNVSKLLVIPNGYTGKLRKGHLIFDACFESGNLGKVVYVSEYEYDLFIRPDTCNARFRVWFNFTVENTKYEQQQRRLDLITITHPSNLNKTADKKRVIFVTARVHPGETPSSYVCQGFIDFMVSNHSIAQQLREHLIFKIVPMLNPDGVYLGNYRSSLMGFDLNRQWQSPSLWAHPTIYATKQLLMNLDNNPFIDVNFFIDIHAHSTLMNGFMYGNIYEDEKRAERQARFPSLLSQFAEDFSLPQTNFNKDTLKAGTGRRTLGGILDDHTICYTLEVSFYSYTNMLTNEMIPYTEEKYARLGRNLARTFYEYYSNEGILCNMSSSSRVDSIHSPGNISISSYSLRNNHNLSNVNLEDDHSQHHHSNDVKNYGINKESIVQPTSSKDCLEDRLKYNYDQLKRLNQTLNSLKLNNNLINCLWWGNAT
ncbi:unnamed protein product [Schistosoma intercalatum]|nr:unnamed protein product [Schistosoma intercalatum]